METKVSPASVEVSSMFQAMFFQARLGLFVSSFDGDTDLLEYSKLVSSEDDFGISITIPCLVHFAVCDISRYLKSGYFEYLYNLSEDLKMFWGDFAHKLSEYQCKELCSIVDDIDAYLSTVENPNVVIFW